MFLHNFMNVDYNTCHVFKYLIVLVFSPEWPFKDSERNVIFGLQ